MNFYKSYFIPTLLSLLHSSVALSSTTKTTTFYILRHGETDTNVAGIISGSSDKPYLTAAGKSQAEMVGNMALTQIMEKTTQTNRIDAIFVSPLTRARDTLAFFRKNAPPDMKLPPPEDDVVLDNLREIDFYSWTYQSKDVLQQKHPKEFAAFRRGDPDGLVVDGHFPLHEVWDRAQNVWKEIRSTVCGKDSETAKHILLVCHGTLGQALLGSAFGKNATAFRQHPFENCQMAEINWHDQDDLATSWNWVSVCED